MKYIELKLAGLSVVLITIGFFLSRIVKDSLHTTDIDYAEIMGFLVLVAFVVVGVALGIASIAVLLFRLGDR
jgi:hypothetical protein